MRTHSLALLVVLTSSGALPAHADMKMGTFTSSGALVVADTFDKALLHKSTFSSDDLERMARQLEEQQRTLKEHAQDIEQLQRQSSQSNQSSQSSQSNQTQELQRTAQEQEQERQIDQLERKLEQLSRTVDDLKRSR